MSKTLNELIQEFNVLSEITPDDYISRGKILYVIRTILFTEACDDLLNKIGVNLKRAEIDMMIEIYKISKNLCNKFKNYINRQGLEHSYITLKLIKKSYLLELSRCIEEHNFTDTQITNIKRYMIEYACDVNTAINMAQGSSLRKHKIKNQKQQNK